jgi:hypothetical protein
MDFTTVCPHCSTKLEHGLDLGVVLEKIALGNWDSSINIQDLEITLRPQSYEEYNKNNMTNFEEQRIMQLVRDTDLPDDEKTKKFDELFQKLIETGIAQVSRSVASIKIEDIVVTDPGHIREFFNNCDRSIWEAVKNRLDDIKKENNYTYLPLFHQVV